MLLGILSQVLLHPIALSFSISDTPLHPVGLALSSIEHTVLWNVWLFRTRGTEKRPGKDLFLTEECAFGWNLFYYSEKKKKTSSTMTISYCVFLLFSSVDAWSVAFSPDSKYIATGSHLGKVNIFGVESGKKEYSLDTRGKFILSIAYVRNHKLPVVWNSLFKDKIVIF